MPHKYLFQLPRHASFVLTESMLASWKKTAFHCGPFQSLPNQKYLGWDYEIWSASMQDTYKNTEKNSGFCNFQGQCNLNFCIGQFL